MSEEEVTDAQILVERINAVVEARAKAIEATDRRMEAYGFWLKEHEQLLLNEKAARVDCAEAEDELRALAIKTYEETGDKAIAPGIGIRVRTVLGYLASEAMEWAMEHKLALKLDSSAFEKIAKTSHLPFVTISEEPQATIATELNRID